jgi:hypothetical protein
MMEELTVAVTVEPVVLLKYVDGDHEYVLAPLAEIVTGTPEQ